MRLWPASIAGRTFLVLLVGLFAAQVVGLTIHAFDRVALQRAAQAREAMGRTWALWRAVVTAPPGARPEVVESVELPEGFRATLGPAPLVREGAIAPGPRERRLAEALGHMGPPRLRPREVRIGAAPEGGVAAALRLPEGEWLNIAGRWPRPQPWSSPTFLAALAVMTAAVAGLSFWAVRRLTAPIRDLAAAAERLGRDVSSPPLPEHGPREVAQAAAAFNTMQARIRRFVEDRTAMLAAIGHDLRTPITRLRLRAEFIEDESLRARMLADLAEMEAMVAATLAFARDDAAAETAVPLDLAALLRTVADEANDVAGREAVTLEAPAHRTVTARPVALKRALGNLVGNAVAYAGSCRVRLAEGGNGTVRITIEDDGPGIPEDELERVFQPFHRVERSRSRETGGAGLGLPIARTILRGHGGDVTLANRPGGGLVATVTLPG
ncbi:HAMP domain-containing protein [Elioraea sp. Yellowstone]|uniref:ATP-binding protein n=1 Tax=Elioraea sp. Yellowstone TaxID=2592070 RepID=UPI0011510A48|nr:ATP-binding protein [Elioraea sp. Yellowstone]TQF76353.1 HAMP domain-containing protein [Elioraea sp. Yellowstone]